MSSEKSKKTKKTKSSKKETTHHSTLVPSEHIRDRVKELDRERKVYILYTGGTIGMVHKEGVGLVPEPGYLPELISKMKIDKHFKINYTLEATDPLIDSSNLRPNNWKVMVDKIKKNYDRYDSFIIIHGTDTLAYTASALSFFIQNLEKPIIVTGSQLPLTDFRNDASDNIVNSFNLSLFNIPEVLVCFGNRVFRGNRTRKVSSESFIAYDTPNYPILGNIGVNLKIHENLLLPQKTCRLDTLNEWRDDVMILQLRLMPIDNGVILNKLLELKPRAIMLNSYGIGNAPVSDTDFMKALGKAIKSGVIVIDTTQCFHGTVNMSIYHTGRALSEVGVIGALDMTPEAVFTKLYYLFQRYDNNIDKIKSLFVKDLAGELTSVKYTTIAPKVSNIVVS